MLFELHFLTKRKENVLGRHRYEHTKTLKAEGPTVTRPKLEEKYQ